MKKYSVKFDNGHKHETSRPLVDSQLLLANSSCQLMFLARLVHSRMLYVANIYILYVRTIVAAKIPTDFVVA